MIDVNTTDHSKTDVETTRYELILNQGFWLQAAGRMTIHGLDAIQDVIGTGVKDEAATGEGLADALDFGGI
jgi:hypothetical protein